MVRVSGCCEGEGGRSQGQQHQPINPGAKDVIRMARMNRLKQTAPHYSYSTPRHVDRRADSTRRRAVLTTRSHSLIDGILPRRHRHEPLAPPGTPIPAPPGPRHPRAPAHPPRTSRKRLEPIHGLPHGVQRRLPELHERVRCVGSSQLGVPPCLLAFCFLASLRPCVLAFLFLSSLHPSLLPLLLPPSLRNRAAGKDGRARPVS